MKIGFLKLLPIAFLSISCAGLGDPNYSRLRSWTGELQANYPKVPFVKKYRAQDEGKELHFLAADHERDLKSKTHALIASEMDSFRPDIVIIEGVESTAGTNPQRVLSYLMTSPTQMNEASYAAKLAMEQGALFMGGEVTSKEIKEYFKYESKYNLKDLVGFLLLRSMAAFNESRPELSVAQAIERVYSYIPQDYGLLESELIGEKEFLSWAKGALGKPFSYASLSTDDVAPICEESALKSQKINCEINKIRNTHLVSVIHESLRTYNKVLVVYGAGHLVQVDDALSSFVISDYYGTYRGTLPCADCEGIDTEFSITSNGKFQLSRHYLGVEDERRFMGSGTCELEPRGGVLRCHSQESSGELYFLISNQSLEVADNKYEGTGSYLFKTSAP